MKHSFKSLSIFVCILLTTVLSACSLSEKNMAQEDTVAAFDAFTTELFRKEISENTINLHFTLAYPEKSGITEYEITLGDLSEKAYADSNARIENYLKTLENFKKKQLTKNQQLTYDILKDYFTLQLNTASYYLYDEPLSPSSGVHAQLPLLFEEYIFYDQNDIENYLTLLSLTNDYFAQIIAFEKQKAAAGLFMPDYSCNSVISQCNDFIAVADEHYLIDTFNQRIEAFSDLPRETKDAYISQNEKLVKEDLVAAYQYLASEMTSLLSSGRNEQGLCYFPEGKDYYESLVYYRTGCSEDIIDIQEKVSEERTQVLNEAALLMQETPALLEKCEETVLTAKDPTLTLQELQSDMLLAFPAPPDADFSVNYIAESIADYVAPAYYISAPIDAYDNHSIYINADTDTTDINYFTTLAHEGFPGHLYQTVMTYESGLDPVRNLTNYSGYTEGWATYVEMISYHYADIDTSVASFLQMNQSILLSLYASTDLGIHYDGWSLEDTINFWAGYGISDSDTIKEIYEYIVGEPANYLQYYIGYLEFLQLREDAIEEYGSSFNETAFHQALLSIGPAPFDIIEEYLPHYYQP